MNDDQFSRNRYITAFTELNAAVFVARELVWEAERRVERALLARVAGSDLAFRCERCSALVWVEIAENGRPILVEADGQPHGDDCQMQRELFDSGEVSAWADASLNGGKTHDETGN